MDEKFILRRRKSIFPHQNTDYPSGWSVLFFALPVVHRTPCLLLEEKVPSAARRMRCFLTLRTQANLFPPTLDRQCDKKRIFLPAPPVVLRSSDADTSSVTAYRRATFPSRGRLSRHPAHSDFAPAHAQPVMHFLTECLSNRGARGGKACLG